ncbi:MAG: hypothetical protein GEU75_07155 [Dehalococcoidia bacterium]|nr:hypothetical protein [Dehalococcoidia bacterium]
MVGQAENRPFEEDSPPVFPDDIEELAVNTAKLVGNPRVPTLANRTHPAIAKLIEEDASRRAESSNRIFSYNSRQPRFDAPGDQRRLRIANALFLTLVRLEAEPGTREHEGKFEFGAVVGNTWVPITIASTTAKSSKGTTSKQQRLVVSVTAQGIPGCKDGIWTESGWPIELQIGEIATGVIVAGELLHRSREEEWYARWLKTKRWLEEEDRKRQLEAKRREQERQRAEAQARIDNLLAEAQQFRLAADIRAYVSAACQADFEAVRPIEKETIESWAAWAIAEADRIDPVLSGKFAKEFRKQD